MQPDLSVVIPAYNEGEHLGEVIRETVRALRSIPAFEVCVINNGSTDSTQDVIARAEKEDSRVVGISFVQNQGYGGAILSGIAQSHGKYVAWMDADGQADPKDLVRLYDAMQGKAELAKGVRVVRSDPTWRKAQSVVFQLIFRILFLTKYRDINAKPKMLTRGAFEQLDLRSKDFFLDPEFVIKALRHHIPITEVEIEWRARKSGFTKMHILDAFEFLRNMIAFRLRMR
jgi:glycosyltransferase involved in cell wall biosynthesis